MRCHLCGGTIALVVALGCSASSNAKFDRAGNHDNPGGSTSASGGGAGAGPSQVSNTGGTWGGGRDGGRALEAGTVHRTSTGGSAGRDCNGLDCEFVVHGGLDASRECEGGRCPRDGDAGRSDAGDSGADSGANYGDFCATAPWMNSPVAFSSPDGRTTLPAGTYTLRYVSGAQIHDASEGYEVTAHYMIGSIEAGHHLFNGATPETSSTSVWLDDTGTIGSQPTVLDVEQKNAGHTWSFQHAGGPLLITYYDDYYGDNQGPGTRLCIAARR